MQCGVIIKGNIAKVL